MSIEFIRTIPILRIFSVEKAKEFYIGWLGFKIDWEHQFEKNTPRYIQVSRGHLVLHLSEHHGDACPGSAVSVEMQGAWRISPRDRWEELQVQPPGLEHTPWQAKGCEVIDPFGNRIRFSEHAAK